MRKLPSAANCIFDSQLFSIQVYSFLIKNSQLSKLIKIFHIKNIRRRWGAISLLLFNINSHLIFNFLQKFKIGRGKSKSSKLLKAAISFARPIQPQRFMTSVKFYTKELINQHCKLNLR